jgi:signal transduction histidine kinase
MNAPSPQDHDARLLAQGGLPALIIRNKEQLLEDFCQRVQQDLPGARRASHPVLIDTLPAFITRIAMALSDQEQLDFATQYTSIPLQHGNERARFTRYTLAEVLREHQFLRELLADLFVRAGDVGEAQWRILHRSIDEAMADSATSFVAVHDNFREMFIAALTHDFRGPLSSAWNYLELMRRGVDRKEQEEYANRAARSLARIGSMIGNLLDAGRSNAGERLAVDPSACDVAELLVDVIADLESRPRERVQLDVPASILAYWDREKVRRAVFNLLDNAIKYSTPASKITVRAIETEGRVHVSVHNLGDVIALEDQRTLFEPYRRSTLAQKSGKSGWGLGLVQVEAIAEAHGGVVNVDSRPENGTTFTLDLVRDVRDLRTPDNDGG